MSLHFAKQRAVLLAVLCGLALAAGCAALDVKQREWIFQPSDRTWSGGLAAAEGMEEVWINYTPGQRTDMSSRASASTSGSSSTSASGPAAVRLHGLWVGQANPNAPVLLYLHGARWDVRGSANRMRRMHELGFAVLGVDYRGFGQSSPATPSEDMAYEDARAAWDWLAQRHPTAPRYIFGHSLGGAVAVHLATEVSDAKGLLVEGSFTSIPDVVKHFKWGWLPLGPLITQRFDAGSRIAKLRVPLLVVHGSQDSLIAPELGRALFERAPHPKRFELVQGGSHHNTNAVGQAQYREALRDLMGLGGSPGPARASPPL